MDELNRVERWKKLTRVWEMEDGLWWYPLVDISRTDVVAFEAVPFHAAVGAAGLRTVLAQRGIRSMWYFSDSDHSIGVEMTPEDAHFQYGPIEDYWRGARMEGYWCDANMDWIVYASHEESITLGGQWLIQEVQRLWPEWNRNFWITEGDSNISP